MYKTIQCISRICKILEKKNAINNSVIQINPRIIPEFANPDLTLNPTVKTGSVNTQINVKQGK